MLPIILGIVIGIVVLFGLGTSLAVFIIKRKNSQLKELPYLGSSVELPALSENYRPIPHGNSPLSSKKHGSALDFQNSWEIEEKDLKILEKIGGGSYGVVYKGTWRDTVVASM